MPRNVPVEMRTGAAGAVVVVGAPPVAWSPTRSARRLGDRGRELLDDLLVAQRRHDEHGDRDDRDHAERTAYTRGHRQRNHDSTSQPASSTAFTTSAACCAPPT